MPTSAKRQIVLVVDISNTHQRKIAMGVATYAHENGNWDFHVVQNPVDHLTYFMQDPLESLPDRRTWCADGIIAANLGRKISATIHRLNVPLVGITEHGWGEPGHAIPRVVTDNEAIGRLGAQDFIERGLRRLAFCGIPPARFNRCSEQRQAAFQQFAREAGVPCAVFAGGSARGGTARLREELAAWLQSLDKPVGLMTSYDVRARHVLLACRSLGLSVPEDVAVIGVDNDELMCELSSPPLSSIEQGSRTIGYQAAVLLDQLMSGQNVSQLKFVVKPEGIVTRQSSDCLAIKDVDVAAAIRFIRQRACGGIQVGDVVGAVAVSRSALEARFKAVTGRTIHAEIQRVQLERARQLVAATDLPLKQVAIEAGFKYLQHMTTIFRHYTGQTPGEYRKRSRA